MKREYVKPSIITHEVIVENGILNASTQTFLEGLTDIDFQYKELEIENSTDEWNINEN